MYMYTDVLEAIASCSQPSGYIYIIYIYIYIYIYINTYTYM